MSFVALWVEETPKGWSVPIEMLSTAGIVGAFAWLMLGWLRRQMETQATERTNLMEREATERADMRTERMTLREDTRKEIHALRNLVNEVSLKNAELGFQNAQIQRQFAECEAHRVDQDANIKRLETDLAEVKRLQAERLNRELP